MDFDCFHRGRVCGGVAIVVEEVAAGCDSGAVRFVFFWSIGYGVPWICHFLSVGYVAFVDPFQHVKSINVAVSLKETGKFVHSRLFPSASYVGMVDEVFSCGKLLELVVPNSATRKCKMWVVSRSATVRCCATEVESSMDRLH